MWHLLLYIAAKWWGMLYIRGVLRFLKSTEILIRQQILHETRRNSNILLHKKLDDAKKFHFIFCFYEKSFANCKIDF